MLRNKFKLACLLATQALVTVAFAATQTTPISTAAVASASSAPAATTSATTAIVTPAVATGAMSAPSSAAPASVITIKNCTYSNGLLGDANAPIRDFCLTQTTDIDTGKVHKAIDFAMGYYVAMKCTAASSVLPGNCQNAANTIANGVAHAFHLDYTTLNKIRSAVPPGSTGGCPCAAAS